MTEPSTSAPSPPEPEAIVLPLVVTSYQTVQNENTTLIQPETQNTVPVVATSRSSIRKSRQSRLSGTKRTSIVPFTHNPQLELDPYILVDNVQKKQPDNGGTAATQPPTKVRRRILVEPNFSLQEHTTGQAEDKFRQTILDEGITDEALRKEIERGATSGYELGDRQPLRNVHDYVDYSSWQQVELYTREHAAGNILSSNSFRYMVLVVILANAVLIGIETNQKLILRYGNIIEGLESAIMAAFILEILLKWYYHFDVFWKGGWNILDFLIVVVLFFGSGFLGKGVGTTRILRILRVVRAFRSLRETPLFSGLSLIFDTLTRSLTDLFYICILMLLVMCLLAVVGVQILAEVSPDSFGSFTDALFAVVICQTQRGWIDIFNVFIAAGWTSYVGGFLYFLLTIVLTSWVLKNMFVATLISNLRVEMRLNKEERARKQAKMDNSRSIKDVSPGEDDDGGDEGEQVNIQPMIEAARGLKAGDGSRRVLSPMFLGKVASDDVCQYLFLHNALEENLRRYRELRIRLKDVTFAVKGFNPTYFRELIKGGGQVTQKRKSKVRSSKL